MVLPDAERALRTARTLLSMGYPLETVVNNSLIPDEYREFVRRELIRESNLVVTPARALLRDPDRPDWLAGLDRSRWHYWPALREYLVAEAGWNRQMLGSLDDSSDRVMRQLEPPSTARFETRGLVLGFVQSGKTANFTALAAKAADTGYKLVIVLSGIDNGLRRQTNVRLKRELVGYSDGHHPSVRLPPSGYQWHEFTRPEFNGDFQPGYANHAALQGAEPVLLVVKKNGPVLRRLLRWLEGAPAQVFHDLPVLVIDDEADLASVDTRGTYQTSSGPVDADNADYEPPSVINGLIRTLLRLFDRIAYVAYTATPFANILIPHDTLDPTVGNDLYPKDFILDLPKPPGYFGAEELFGMPDEDAGHVTGRMDAIRDLVTDSDLATLEQGQVPESLSHAVHDFVLAGAARAQRGDGAQPSTMLVHTSPYIATQSQLRGLVADHFAAVKNEWRYQREGGIRERFSQRWEDEFRRITSESYPSRDVPFDQIEPHIGPFLEAVQVREVNSSQNGEVLDYEREPSLKAIAVGGNKLSRGLTLEGLTVSYFVRPSATYDTLMQMGRWFGFRPGYEDLTRIWTTKELAGWFSDLAFAEHQLREDIQVYEELGLTPYEVGMRIWQHPTMQVTAPLKRRFASDTVIKQDYSLTLQQTFKFPLRRPMDLMRQAQANKEAVRQLVRELISQSIPQSDQDSGPIWTRAPAAVVLSFLGSYQVDEESRSLSIPLIRAYIERMASVGELVNWTVAVRGRGTPEPRLGYTDWGLPRREVCQISRSRQDDTDSLGVITDNAATDEGAGFTAQQMEQVDAKVEASRSQGSRLGRNVAARELRPPEEGLLLLYPISRGSEPRQDPAGGRGNRKPLFEDPSGPSACDLVGIALSFPRSTQPQQVEAYLQGTVGWRPVE
jgi:hypothetical protein